MTALKSFQKLNYLYERITYKINNTEDFSLKIIPHKYLKS